MLQPPSGKLDGSFSPPPAPRRVKPVEAGLALASRPAYVLLSVFIRYNEVRLPAAARRRDVPKTDLNFGGGDYAPVADRVRLFYERYPTGRIVTHLVRRTEVEVVFRAEVFRSPSERPFVPT